MKSNHGAPQSQPFHPGCSFTGLEFSSRANPDPQEYRRSWISLINGKRRAIPKQAQSVPSQQQPAKSLYMHQRDTCIFDLHSCCPDTVVNLAMSPGSDGIQCRHRKLQHIVHEACTANLQVSMMCDKRRERQLKDLARATFV